MTTNEAKREAILEAGSALLLKHGLRSTSMEAIARAAGVAKPTLYAYFPDKTAIFSTLVDQLIAGWLQNFCQVLRGDGDIVARVGGALVARHKSAMQLFARSPHAAELYSERERIAAPRLLAFETAIGEALEAELARAGVARARLLTQVLLAASAGVAQKAQAPAELGPALRLLAERLIRPELV